MDLFGFVNSKSKRLDTNIKRSRKLHELRYFQEVVALAPEVETLLSVKAHYVHDGVFRYPEGLKIYFNGKEEWIFDEKITPRDAVRFF